MDFKSIPKKYRPLPFWSWNEKLNCEETVRQVSIMDTAGIGGFFMHARGGLKTEYMGEEWFENIAAATEEGRRRGMRPWAYDENGWPSGFGNGAVNGLGVDYQQKYLRMETEPEHTETQICKCGDRYFYYEVNPFYVDTLDGKVAAEFIKCTYEPYYEKYGQKIEGFFTDEPQISRNGIPWSFVFEEEYKTRYHEDLLCCIDQLFLEHGDYKTTRIRFWKMVTDLFSKNFMKQIYDWCDERGLKLTGHLVVEENAWSQLASNGACMPHYEYFHIPGIDWLGRDIYSCLTVKQLTSAAAQLGKKSVLSETFALCGHNVSFAELKGIYEWQMVRGVNLLCQHLEGYSLRGIRKRDYPPAMYYQQPWWSEYEKFNTAMARLGMITAESEAKTEVLVIHPQTTAWVLYNCGECKGLEELALGFPVELEKLDKKHIDYHLGDETLIERHGRVEDGMFVIGNQRYSKVITEYCDVLLESTQKLLDEFVGNGGQICTVNELEDNPVIDREDITYTLRYLEDKKVHYFVNTSAERKDAEIFVSGKRLDIYSGEIYGFGGKHSFEPWGSLMLIDDGTENRMINEDEFLVFPKGKFEISGEVENCITLDCCDYYFDGELQEKNGYVLNICERANALERPVEIHQEYYINVDAVPKTLFLACENPERFVIKINGRTVEKTYCGYFRDRSFEKIDIAKYICEGKNIISFDCLFVQSDEFYENLKKAYKFESELNKLAYDMEIEAIYLVGNFSVKTPGKWTELEREAVRYQGAFVIDAPAKSISLKDIHKQGFPFFSGELTVEGDLVAERDNPTLVLDMTGVNAVRVEIDGICATVLTDDRIKLDIRKGRYKIKLTLINNLRNLLGPHHLEEGEDFSVGANKFYKEPCVWNYFNWAGDVEWNDDYCFVRFGVRR